MEETEGLLGRGGPDYRQVLPSLPYDMMIINRSYMLLTFECYDNDEDDQVRRWRQCVSRIEPLAGLIFGLELRLEEAKEGRQPLEVIPITIISLLS